MLRLTPATKAVSSTIQLKIFLSRARGLGVPGCGADCGRELRSMADSSDLANRARSRERHKVPGRVNRPLQIAMSRQLIPCETTVSISRRESAGLWSKHHDASRSANRLHDPPNSCIEITPVTKSRQLSGPGALATRSRLLECGW